MGIAPPRLRTVVLCASATLCLGLTGTRGAACREPAAGGAPTAGAAASTSAADETPTADEAAVIDLVNHARATKRLPALVLAPNLVAHARAHSARMARRGEIFHDAGRTTRVFVEAGWTGFSENVGMGASPASVHAALMRSRGHRANILGAYTHVAVGVVEAEDGTLYVTQLFATTSPPERRRTR